jgi:phospholipid N-methyltransferase
MNSVDKTRAQIAGAVQFFRRGWDDFDTTANFIPSSRWLVRQMLSRVPQGAKCVVEFGSGTGTLTREILKKLAPDGRLYAVELEQTLLDASVLSIGDSRMIPVLGSAVDAPTLLGAQVTGHTDGVISSLGLSMMDEAVRVGIMQSASALLGPSAMFAQYAYIHARWAAYSPGRKLWFQWDAVPFMSQHWRHVERSIVLKNIPPAWVFACRGGVKQPG